MPMIRFFYIALFAVFLALGPASPHALAADSHSHDGHDANASKLMLDSGKKWRGDDSMLKGMGEIRAALAARLEQIHHDRLTKQEYGILATSVQGQIDYMVQNCRLPQEVDEQFHIVLGDIIDGISLMEGGSHPRDGAVKIVLALNAYGKHFEHPKWQPLGK